MAIDDHELRTDGFVHNKKDLYRAGFLSPAYVGKALRRVSFGTEYHGWHTQNGRIRRRIFSRAVRSMHMPRGIGPTRTS
jgi:hypothetical protein